MRGRAGPFGPAFFGQRKIAREHHQSQRATTMASGRRARTFLNAGTPRFASTNGIRVRRTPSTKTMNVIGRNRASAQKTASCGNEKLSSEKKRNGLDAMSCQQAIRPRRFELEPKRLAAPVNEMSSSMSRRSRPASNTPRHGTDLSSRAAEQNRPRLHGVSATDRDRRLHRTAGIDAALPGMRAPVAVAIADGPRLTTGAQRARPTCALVILASVGAPHCRIVIVSSALRISSTRSTPS